MRSLSCALLLVSAACHHGVPGSSEPTAETAITTVESCPDGNARGCAFLANQYAEGQGRPRDLNRAATLHRFACDHGWAESCTALAEFTREGTGGIAPDPVESLRLLERGCAGGDGTGCVILGELFVRGQRVPVDRARAEDLYRRGCEAREGAACHRLAVMTLETDPEKAIALFRTGCELGAGESCQAVGMMVMLGNGVPQDVEEGLALLKRGCKLGDDLACFNEARVLAIHDAPKALERFSALCRRDARGCTAGAEVARRLGDRDALLELATRGCANGSTEACSLKATAEAADSERQDRETPNEGRAPTLEELQGTWGLDCAVTSVVFAKHFAHEPDEATCAKTQMVMSINGTTLTNSRSSAGGPVETSGVVEVSDAGTTLRMHGPDGGLGATPTDLRLRGTQLWLIVPGSKLPPVVFERKSP